MASTLHFSNQFAISCGTVSIDIERSKVLLIRWRKTGEHFLPKGRKDVNETLEQAALRETFEETGIPVKLLPVEIKTMATLPSSIEEEDRPRAVTEPIAVAQRVHKGVLKIIFWYAAVADFTATPVKGTQQEGEDFETVWADLDHFRSVLSFDDDRDIAEAAIIAVRKAAAAS